MNSIEESVLPGLEVSLTSEGDSQSKGGSLYSFIKTIARMPLDEGRQMLRERVKAHNNINALSIKGSTGLHACAYLKRWDLATILINAGANPDIKNQAGHSFWGTLFLNPKSTWENELAIDAELLKSQIELWSEKIHKKQKNKKNVVSKKGTDKKNNNLSPRQKVDILNEKQKSFKIVFDPLVAEAVKEMDWEALKDFYQLYKNKSVTFLSQKDVWDIVFSSYKREEFLKLMSYSPQMEKRFFENSHPILLSLITKDASLFNILMAHGFDVNAVNASGQRALDLAIEKADVEWVERLVSCGADISKSDYLSPPDYLAYAKQHGFVEIAEFLSYEKEDASRRVSSLAHKKTNANVIQKGKKTNVSKSTKGSKLQKVGLSKGKKVAINSSSKSSKKGKSKKDMSGLFVANLSTPLKEAREINYAESIDMNKTVVVVKKKKVLSKDPLIDIQSIGE